jgi:xylan 1,4-beta-xylosidase
MPHDSHPAIAARAASAGVIRRLPIAASTRVLEIWATVVLCLALVQAAVADRIAPETIRISADGPVTALPHFWETMFGSGRAILSLRDSYRQDLRAVKAVTNFRYVRFHNIFHDEVGLVGRDAAGHVTYNFSYVDQIYDGLLENGVRPFVELGFMPAALTSDPAAVHPFWYHPNVAPPADFAAWDDLVRHFAAHLVVRYGVDEVAAWYFEVWNEPNLDFWSGRPAQSTYFDLYAHTALALKSVDTRLRVGGPATAQAAWVPEFLRYAHDTATPVDFVTSHVYGNDPADQVLGGKVSASRNDLVCRAAQKLAGEIHESAYPALPLILSEYNASYRNEPSVTDTVYMGPWIADTIRQCAGRVELLSYWTFSDVFEEQGMVRTPFYGGFGLMAERGIAKPAYNAFALLHRLGDLRLAADSTSALATRREDGTLVIALWNYQDPDPPDEAQGSHPQGSHPSYPSRTNPDKRFQIIINGLHPAAVRLWRLDATHGNVIAAFDALGRPASPTRLQVDALRAASQQPDAEVVVPHGNRIEVSVPGQGLALLEVSP